MANSWQHCGYTTSSFYQLFSHCHFLLVIGCKYSSNQCFPGMSVQSRYSDFYDCMYITLICHHHHHHVQEGLGLILFLVSSKWNWSLHLFLGRPMCLRPFGLYCSACLGILFVSILCMCCSLFSWYCFISFTIFSAPVFFPNTLVFFFFI